VALGAFNKKLILSNFTIIKSDVLPNITLYSFGFYKIDIFE